MLKEKDLDIALSCHLLYTKQAKGAIVKLLKRHYPDTWEDIFEKIQKRYVNYLKDYRRDLGGKKNFHNGVGGNYDGIFYFCMWEICKGEITFTEVEQNYDELMRPTYAWMKLLNGNNRLVKCLMYFAFKNVKGRCDVFGDYNMQVDPYDKNKPLTYHFTTCPVAEFAREHGFTDILPALCNVDYSIMDAMHVRLIRKQTLGFADNCDYMMVGDKDPLVKEHPRYRDEKGYIRNK